MRTVKDPDVGDRDGRLVGIRTWRRERDRFDPASYASTVPLAAVLLGPMSGASQTRAMRPTPTDAASRCRLEPFIAR
jgi:hypothetical protein